jgi:hypothetical protein
MTKLIKKGNSLSQISLQPGWVIENDGYGLLTSQLTFVCDASSVSAKAPKVKSVHPEDSRLTCAKSSYVVNANGIAVITSSYLGIESGNFTRFQVTGQVALTTQPIQTHPKFVTGKAGSSGKPLKDLGWDNETQTFPSTDADAVTYGLVGVKSYLVPDIQMTGNYYCNSLKGVEDAQKMVGKTFASFAGIEDFPNPKTGSPVTSYHDRFGLVTGCTYENYGTVFKVSFTFRLASGGWNGLVYEKSN